MTVFTPSKSLVLIAAMLTALARGTRADETVLAGWHDFSAGFRLYEFAGSAKAADTTELSDVGGTLWGGGGSRDTWGSTDGTYGPVEPVGNADVNGTMSLRTDRPLLNFSVVNNGATAVLLNRILFDFASVRTSSPQNLTLLYWNGDLDDADGSEIAAWTAIQNGLDLISDHEDVEVNLNVLSDQILGPGETATFRFVPDTANNNTQAMSIDNVAVMGTATPKTLRVLTYNIHGGEGPNGEGDPLSNLTAFRNNLMNDEDILCLQEVNNGDCWTAVQAVFSDYPHVFRTFNETTRFFSSGVTSIAILSKLPFTSTDSQLIQTDPGGDRWERHAQHVTIQLGTNVVDLFNFHNTYNWFYDEHEYERLGLEKFRDNYVFPRLGISSVAEADRLIMLGDFNVLHANVTAILNPPALKFNGLDHVASASMFIQSGVYNTTGPDLSDHNAVWASLDVQAPSPDPLTWLTAPEATSRTTIRMVATSAADPSGVEYYFTNTTVGDGSHDSGWQDSPIYVDRGLTGNTTYEYTVMVRDKSVNANQAEISGSAAATTVDRIALPYAESFESGMGDWEQVTDDDYDWMVNSGGTPTAASGPSGASDGTGYLYAEGHHGQGAFKTASVQSVFNLSAASRVQLEFDYHMFGPYIDYLSLDVHEGTSWSSNVWTLSGQRHTSSTSAWSTASVDLSDFTGSDRVTLRFRTAHLRWNAADPAFDNVRIWDPLLAHWLMDDNAGAVVSDAAYNGFDATQSNASQVPGVNGSALEFNGSSSTVTLPALAFASIEDAITVAMWVKGADHPPQDDSVFYAVNAAGNRVLNVHLPLGDGEVFWDAGYAGMVDRIHRPAAASETEGQWNHWAFTKHAVTGSMAIYLNGALWHSGTNKFRSMAGITQAALGSQISGLYYSGVIDDVRLYNMAFDTNQVSDLFASYTASNGVPLGWLMGYGIAPGEAGATADTDLDRQSNELEWIFGTNPLVEDSPIREVTSSTGVVDIMYTRRKLAGVSTYAEWSADMSGSSWETTELSEAVIADDGEVESVRVTVPVNRDKKYIRIRADR